MNLTELTDDELFELRVNISSECERRERLASLPQQIKQMTQTFLAAGGNPDDLTREGAVD